MILADVLRRVDSRKYRILFKLEKTSSQYESEYTGTRHSRLFARNLIVCKKLEVIDRQDMAKEIMAHPLDKKI